MNSRLISLTLQSNLIKSTNYMKQLFLTNLLILVCAQMFAQEQTILVTDVKQSNETLSNTIDTRTLCNRQSFNNIVYKEPANFISNKSLTTNVSSTSVLNTILPGQVTDANQVVTNITGTAVEEDYYGYDEGDYSYNNDVVIKERDDEKADPVSAINADDADAYPWISHDGLRLYYTHDVGGTNYLYFTSRPDLNTPFGNGTELNIEGSGHAMSCWLTQDELDLYYIESGEGLFHVHRNNVNSEFGKAESIELKGEFDGFTSAPSFSPDMSELYFYNGSSEEQILVFHKRGNKYVLDYSMPKANLDAAPGQLSKDGLTYYLSMKDNEAGTEYLYKQTRISLDGKWSDPVRMDNLNNLDVLNIQPSFAADNLTVVFVRNTTDSWSDNDLYFTNLGTPQVISVIEEIPVVVENTLVETNVTPEIITEDNNIDKTELNLNVIPVVSDSKHYDLNVYPNPSNGMFNFSYNVPAGQYTLKVFSMTGQPLYTTILSNEMGVATYDASTLPAGSYFCTLSNDQGVVAHSKMMLVNN